MLPEFLEQLHASLAANPNNVERGRPSTPEVIWH
jgi:hypothetical protein